METGETVTLKNNAGEEVTVEWPFTDRKPNVITDASLAEIVFDKPGIYQVRAQRTDWRSVFLIVRENGFLTSTSSQTP